MSFTNNFGNFTLAEVEDVKTNFAFDSFAINIAVNEEFSIGGRQGIGIVPIIKQAYNPTTKCVDLRRVFKLIFLKCPFERPNSNFENQPERNQHFISWLCTM